MNDHPDLEMLDPSVREIVREVFRDPANGTPDDISQAGCLALAKQGHKAWNAWRVAFPVTKKVTHPFLNLTSPCNYANFSDLKITDSVQFMQFVFGDNTDFSRSTFNGYEAVFEGGNFGENSQFTDTVFACTVNFLGSTFYNRTSFYGAIFEKNASFTHCNFKGEVDFRANVNLNSSANLNGVSFDNSVFSGKIDFSNRKFRGKTSFGRSSLRLESYQNSESVFFNVPPVFSGCEFYDGTTFEEAIFPKPIGSVQHSNAYRKLKKFFSEQSNQAEEQRFFRLEMAEEAAMAKGFQSFIYKAYSTTSDYGFSFTRPLSLFAVALVTASLIYGILSWQTICTQSHCAFSTAWIEFSLLQALPLPGLDKLSDNLRSKLFADSGWSSIAVTLTVILHKAVSLLALFLMGLGLRNLFKLK